MLKVLIEITEARKGHVEQLISSLRQFLPKDEQREQSNRDQIRRARAGLRFDEPVRPERPERAATLPEPDVLALAARELDSLLVSSIELAREWLNWIDHRLKYGVSGLKAEKVSSVVKSWAGSLFSALDLANSLWKQARAGGIDRIRCPRRLSEEAEVIITEVDSKALELASLTRYNKDNINWQQVNEDRDAGMRQIENGAALTLEEALAAIRRAK